MHALRPPRPPLVPAPVCSRQSVLRMRVWYGSVLLYVCVRAQGCVYLHVHASMSVHAYVNTLGTYICVYLHVFIYMYTCVCIYVCLYMHM
jgi:hypothetical protein